MIYNLIRIFLYIPLIIASIFSSKLRRFVTKRMFQTIEIKEKDNMMWVHCASVGEVNLAEPIIKKILEETEDNILLTMMTDTGRKTAEDKYKENKRVNILFFPLDDYFKIRKILNNISLKKLIIVETEIWPNLINLSSKKAKVMMMNGRISNKSIKSYAKIRFILRKIFKNIEIFIMQTEKDRKRIIFLGAPKENVFNYGNLKFNIKLPKHGKKELDELKKYLKLEDEKIWVAGSTRENEEEYILEAFDKIEKTTLIIVPRHIERTEDICERLLRKYNYIKWSELESKLIVDNKGKEERSKKRVIIVDKIGVLRKLYAISDVAYVGGTMVDIGGHSLLEPLFYRRKPIFGIYTQNVKDIAKEILAKGIGTQVVDSGELVEAIKLDLGLEKHKIKPKNKSEEEIEKFFEKNKHVVELTFEKVYND